MTGYAGIQEQGFKQDVREGWGEILCDMWVEVCPGEQKLAMNGRDGLIYMWGFEVVERVRVPSCCPATLK